MRTRTCTTTLAAVCSLLAVSACTAADLDAELRKLGDRIARKS